MARTIPTQSDAEQDPDDPRKQLAWTYVGLKLKDGGQLMAHPDDLADWSEQQYKAGVRWHPELQTIRRLPPRRGEEHWLNPGGVWVPMDYKDPEPIRTPDVTQYSQYEQADLLEQMVRDGKFSPDVVEQLLADGHIREERIIPTAFVRPDPVIDTSALDGLPPEVPKGVERSPKAKGRKKK